MYKLGWCYYNVAEYGEAIDSMKSVVAYAMASEPTQSSSNPHRLLMEEALKDLTRFYADTGDSSEGRAYFTSLGRADLIEAMERYMESYKER